VIFARCLLEQAMAARSSEHPIHFLDLGVIFARCLLE